MLKRGLLFAVVMALASLPSFAGLVQVDTTSGVGVTDLALGAAINFDSWTSSVLNAGNGTSSSPYHAAITSYSSLTNGVLTLSFSQPMISADDDYAMTAFNTNYNATSTTPYRWNDAANGYPYFNYQCYDFTSNAYSPINCPVSRSQFTITLSTPEAYFSFGAFGDVGGNPSITFVDQLGDNLVTSTPDGNGIYAAQATSTGDLITGVIVNTASTDASTWLYQLQYSDRFPEAPEPATSVLLCVGMVGVLWKARRSVRG